MYSLLRHIKTFHQGKRISYPCDVCPGTFATSGTLKNHRASKHGKIGLPEPSHACQLCEIHPFRWPYQLIEHKKNAHQKEKESLICAVCGKKLPDKSSFNRHMREVHAVRFHSCEVCGVVCKRRNDLIRHVKKMHLGHKAKFTCDVCSAEFHLKRLMKKHREEEHGLKEEAPPSSFTCIGCEEVFERKWSMERHQRVTCNAYDVVMRARAIAEQQQQQQMATERIQQTEKETSFEENRFYSLESQ